MTRDGAIEVNETQQTAQRISQREQDADFQKTPEQQAAQDAAAQLDPTATDAAPSACYPRKGGRRHRRARHGAYRRRTDPQSV